MWNLLSLQLISLVFTTQAFHISNDTELPQEKIFNGRITNIADVPYTVYVNANDPKFFQNLGCTGSIISKYWILTAGHCVTGYEDILVYSGTDISWPVLHIDFPIVEHKVETTIVHENYKVFEDENIPLLHDIALIRLKEPMVFDAYRQPIELRSTNVIAGDIALQSGYGKAYPDDPSEDRPLASIYQTVIPYEDCKQFYRSEDISGSFCLRTQSGGGCVGDSGGPAVINGKLAGITSFGWLRYCDGTYGPELFVRVDLYYNWIWQTIANYEHRYHPQNPNYRG